MEPASDSSKINLILKITFVILLRKFVLDHNLIFMIKCDNEKETKEWLNIAKEDKEIAEMTWKTKRYVYAIMFWQQAVEKIIKAYIVEERNILPRKIHDLDQLLQQAKLNIKELDIKKYKRVDESLYAYQIRRFKPSVLF